MTATATENREQDQLVATPETKLLFMARRSDLRLVKYGRYPKYGPGGRQVGEEPGEAVQFHDGILRVPRDGKAELEDGRTIDAAELVQWLESHRRFGDVEEGFWRVDPTAPPVSREELDRLMEAVTNFDVETLGAFVDQEREGWARADLLAPALKALERVKDIQAEAERQAAEDAARAAGGGQ